MVNRRLIVCILILLAMLSLALPIFAQSSVTVVTRANLNLRAAPDGDAAVLGRVPYNTELAANFLSPDRNWVAVDYNGQGGWLSLEYTQVVSGRLRQLGLSDQTFSAGQGGSGVTSGVVVAPTIHLRYRGEPNLEARVLGAIPYQVPVPALGLSDDGLFVQVYYNGQNVWVYRQYVTEVSGSLSSLASGALPSDAAPAPVEPAPAPEETGPTETGETGAAPVEAAPGERRGVFIAYEGSSDAHLWHGHLPSELQAASAESARIIAYVTENSSLIQTCWYTLDVGPDEFIDVAIIERFRVEYTVRLVDAASGAELGVRNYSRDADRCDWDHVPGVEYQAYLPGVPYIEDALGWFNEWLSR